MGGNPPFYSGHGGLLINQIGQLIGAGSMHRQIPAFVFGGLAGFAGIKMCLA
jgi:hypothetical protein